MGGAGWVGAGVGVGRSAAAGAQPGGVVGLIRVKTTEITTIIASIAISSLSITISINMISVSVSVSIVVVAVVGTRGGGI